MVIVDPFAVGGTMVRDLVIDRDDATRYVAAATSITAEDPIEVPLLGARLAGGRDLVVTDLDGGRPWPLTHDALRLLADARRRLAAASARATVRRPESRSCGPGCARRAWTTRSVEAQRPLPRQPALSAVMPTG
ncbi:MAG: hypothetical protein H0V93_04645 [Euzebyales bacterium]|nr:hypothetical protein [Euzebyales bacterium]